MTDTTDPQTAEPLRIPIAHSVRYAARGLPDVPFLYGPGVIRPSEITLTYRAAPDSQLGRVHAYVKGRLWVDEREVPTADGYGQHYDDGLDGWPEWLAEEARLHDPDADRAAVLDEAADDEGDELVCVDECGLCDACGMEPFGTPAEGWREAARFLRRTARESGDRQGALHGARLIETELRRLAAGERDEQQPQQDGAETREWYRTGGFDQHDDYRTDMPAAGERQQPDTETLPSIHANDVQGFCPACGHGVLMLGEGGHVVCTLMDCPKPEAADELLHATAAPVAGQPPADTGEARPRFVRVCIACPECDHTLDENGACANGCHVPPAVVAEPGKENGS